MTKSTKDESVVAEATIEESSAVDTEDASQEVSEDDGRLSDEAAKLIEKYESLSDKKRKDLVETLHEQKESESLRGYQKEALEYFQEAHGVQPTTPKYSQTEERELEVLKREKAISKYSNKFGVKEGAEDVVRNKSFLLAYRKNVKEGLSVERATELALYDNFDRIDAEKREKATRTTAPVSGGSQVSKKENPLLTAIMNQR